MERSTKHHPLYDIPLHPTVMQQTVYPEESFAKVKKYGLPMLLTQDEGVKSFIANLTAQLSERVAGIWESAKGCSGYNEQKPIAEILERWNFSIKIDAEVVHKG
ncbi:hypothetical protein ACFE04_012100 [Oxalis oulophora]